MQPKIGVRVLIWRDGKLLLGQRCGSHGAGQWAAPGGHLEFGETPEDCARREALEETGLRLPRLRRGPFTNNVFLHERKHYVTLFVIADNAEGEPCLLEPEKCTGWAWFAPTELPQPLFAPLVSLLREHGHLPG